MPFATDAFCAALIDAVLSRNRWQSAAKPLRIDACIQLADHYAGRPPTEVSNIFTSPALITLKP